MCAESCRFVFESSRIASLSVRGRMAAREDMRDSRGIEGSAADCRVSCTCGGIRQVASLVKQSQFFSAQALHDKSDIDCAAAATCVGT